MENIKEIKRLFYSRKSGKVTITFDGYKEDEVIIMQIPFQEAIDKNIIGDIFIKHKKKL